MDVAVYPQGRFFVGCACFRIRKGEEPYVAPLVTLADAFYLDEVGIFVGVLMEETREVVVAVVRVEAGGGHEDIVPGEVWRVKVFYERQNNL